jgi:hypothetical protein
MGEGALQLNPRVRGCPQCVRGPAYALHLLNSMKQVRSKVDRSVRVVVILACAVASCAASAACADPGNEEAGQTDADLSGASGTSVRVAGGFRLPTFSASVNAVDYYPIEQFGIRGFVDARALTFAASGASLPPVPQCASVRNDTLCSDAAKAQPSACVKFELVGENCWVASATGFASRLRAAFADPANFRAGAPPRCAGPRSSYRSTTTQQELVCQLGCYSSARGSGAACGTLSNHQRGEAVDLELDGGSGLVHAHGLLSLLKGERWHYSVKGN